MFFQHGSKNMIPDISLLMQLMRSSSLSPCAATPCDWEWEQGAPPPPPPPPLRPRPRRSWGSEMPNNSLAREEDVAAPAFIPAGADSIGWKFTVDIVKKYYSTFFIRCKNGFHSSNCFHSESRQAAVLETLLFSS